MAICLLPTTTSFLPRYIDRVFEDIDYVERSLRRMIQRRAKSGARSNPGELRESSTTGNMEKAVDEGSDSIESMAMITNPKELSLDSSGQTRIFEGGLKVCEDSGLGARSIPHRRTPSEEDLQQIVKPLTVEGQLFIEAQNIKSELSEFQHRKFLTTVDVSA